MIRKTALCFAALACAAASVDAQTKTELRTLALFDRSPDTLIPLIKVEGDSLDPRITISTYGVTAVTSKGLLASTTAENSFMRAFIDRKTGDVSAQIYQSTSYGGRGFNTFSRATYEVPAGVEEVEVTQVGTDVSCSRYGCTHYADVVFPVKLATLKAAAAGYDPSNPRIGLKYRIFGQSGANIDDAVPINEIVAFVNVIDQQVAGLKGKTP